MDGKQIYDNFRNGDTAGLRGAATQVRQLSAAYLERAQGIRDLQNRMAKSWTGGAADAAKAGAGPLELAFHDTADPLDMTTASVDMQASSFEDSSHSVVEVPPKPDKPNPWTTGLKAAIPIAGPFMAAGDEKSYQDSLNRYNTANETNVRVMDQYNGVTTSTKSVLPTGYGTLESDGAAIRLKTPATPGHVVPPGTGKPAQHGGGVSGQGTTPTDSSVVPGGGDSGSHTVTSSVHGGGHPGATGGTTGTTGSGTTGIDTTGSGGTGDTTTSQGTKTGPALVPPGAPPSHGVDVGSGLPSGPGGGTAFVPGGAGGRNPSGADNPEGAAGGRGTSAERGAGSRSGVGGIGSAAAQEAAAARAAQGRAGAAGGPMGAGGRRGEGDEDGEHQRPDYLIEADPDAIFGTDQRTSPPVIGE
ncbi:hypothetical protein OG943_13635 [Amycolatopsis sp. NBC_00345]|uniref:hypothetical protein n=1 Tax=Amycolatopsis sp. NBC_00345 TaxID=2975955 RepID=UPI002E275668